MHLPTSFRFSTRIAVAAILLTANAMGDCSPGQLCRIGGASSFLFVNIGFIPFNHYDDVSLNQIGTDPYVNGCPTTATVRYCFQQLFYNYRLQHVTGIRFFFGLDDPTWSGPINNDNTINSDWTAGVGRFFTDLQLAGISYVVPTPTFLSNVITGSGTSGCVSGQPLKFSRYSPLGRTFTTDAQNNVILGLPEGPENNSCYNNGAFNPYFVGWNILAGVNGVFDTMFAQAAGKVNVFEFDVEQELNLRYLPIQGRLIYDNKHGLAPGSSGSTDVLAMIRARMSAYGFSQYSVTYSAAEVNPDSTYPNLDPLGPFTDVPASSAYAFAVHIMKQAGSNFGSRGFFAPPFAMPDDQHLNPTVFITRAEAAALIIRSIYWNDSFPEPPPSNFQDVPVWHPFYRFVNKVRELGITAGCTVNPDNFCPDTIITNAQLAVFAVRAWQILNKGSRYWTFQYTGSQMYGDVPVSNIYFPYIAKMYDLHAIGATGPNCSPSNYCPDNFLGRGFANLFLSGGPLGKPVDFGPGASIPFFCYTSYGDSGRLVTLSAVDAAMTGDFFGEYLGLPRHDTHGQNCSVRTPSLDSASGRPSIPVFHAASYPADIHTRPAVLNQPSSDVKSEARQTYDDIHWWWQRRYPNNWAAIHLGETWTVNNPCPDDNGVLDPPNAATAMINGFNASFLASAVLATVMNHWSDHTNVSCRSIPWPVYTIRPPYDPSFP